MNTYENAIEINGLNVKFGAFTAVDNISFKVKKGEIFGFLGANGAGKTTTIRVLCGLLVPSSGSVTVSGLKVDKDPSAIKQKVGYMSQKFTLYNDMTVSENLDFKAALRKMDKANARKESKRLLDFIGYRGSTDTLVRNLPAGVKQQVSLVASIIHDPDVIFLDEPTSGVSPAVRALFWDLIRTLSSQGKTIIVTTHYMDEADECERIALMQRGRIVALAGPEELKRQTYKEPLLEIYAEKASERENVLALIESYPDMVRFWPYGLKYHSVLKDEAAYDDFKNSLPSGIVSKRISPSLEDVFVRLVSEEKW